MPRRGREELLGGNNDVEERIEYGYRRARRDTSIQYRDSSSLSPLQFMEQEVCYNYAIISVLKAMHIATLASILLVVYNNYKRMVSYWDRISDGLNSTSRRGAARRGAARRLASSKSCGAIISSIWIRLGYGMGK